MGFYLPSRPGDDVPVMPGDLTELEDRDLMILFGQYTAWCNYADTKLSLAEVEEAKLSDTLTFAEAEATILGWDVDEKDKRVTITKARKLSSPEVQAAVDGLRVAHAHRKLLAAMAKIFERDIALVSRELSRRIGTADVSRRSAKWGGG